MMTESRILVIDDNDAGRYVTKRMLASGGYAVHDAGTGEKGFALARSLLPALVILDIHLPDIDGFEVCRRMKADSATSRIPILHLSAERTRSSDRVQGLQCGADAYLVQPVEADELLATVSALIRSHRAEAALRESEEHWRGLFERLHEGLILGEVVYDASGRPADWRFLDVNPAWEKLLGMPRAHAVGRMVREVIPGVEDIWVEEFTRAAETGEPCRFTRQIGVLGRWYEGHVFQTRPGRFAVLFFEVTERKHAEEALRASRQLLAEAERLSHTGAWEWDIAADKWELSEEWLRIHGTYKRSLAGSEVLSLAHPEDRPRVIQAFQEVRSGLKPYAIEHRILRADNGEERILSARGQYVKDEQGRVVRVYGFVRDVTEQKRLEEELRAAMTSAERARSEAERANAAKDEFLAVLSHELRTPLAPVLAGISLIRRKQCAHCELKNELEVVQRNIQLEARLIDDLLDLTRIERGKVSLERTPVDLSTVLERVADVCSPDIKARRLAFSLDMADRPYRVEGDFSRLQQIFWNLLNNAVKFTPDGGSIAVSSKREDDRVVVEVADTGIGVEAEAAGRIFSAFEQASARVTRQFGGLGLGLAITKRLVELHGGSISVTSLGLGHGATFQVVLPLLNAEEAADKRAEQAVSAALSGTAPSKRILLVEDHADTAMMMKQLLEVSGYEVQTAPNAAQSLEAASSADFDLMISDIGLPDKSGLQLMEELRAQGSVLKGIALSGYGREDDVRRSLESGFSAHLTKPVDLEALMRTIETVTQSP